MKKLNKIRLFLTIILPITVLFSTSCNSDKSTTKEIDLSDISILGEDNQYIEVVPDTYIFKLERSANNKDYYFISVVLNLKLVSEVGVLEGKKPQYETSEYSSNPFSVALLDSDDQQLESGQLDLGEGGAAKLDNLLRSPEGTEVKIKFSKSYNEKYAINLFDKISSIELLNASFVKIVDYSLNDDASETVSDTGSVSNEMDASSSINDIYNESIKQTNKILKEVSEDKDLKKAMNLYQKSAKMTNKLLKMIGKEEDEDEDDD